MRAQLALGTRCETIAKIICLGCQNSLKAKCDHNCSKAIRNCFLVKQIVAKGQPEQTQNCEEQKFNSFLPYHRLFKDLFAFSGENVLADPNAGFLLTHFPKDSDCLHRDYISNSNHFSLFFFFPTSTYSSIFSLHYRIPPQNIMKCMALVSKSPPSPPILKKPKQTPAGHFNIPSNIPCPPHQYTCYLSFHSKSTSSQAGEKNSSNFFLGIFCQHPYHMLTCFLTHRDIQ